MNRTFLHLPKENIEMKQQCEICTYCGNEPPKFNLNENMLILCAPSNENELLC